MSPPDPARLGEYHLLEKLGQGGMAMVYRAERIGEAGFKKKVAIKRMLPVYRRDPSLLERFAAEARTNARLDHPNLVHVLDFGIDPEPYLVMELVEGITLALVLQRLVEQRQQLEVAAACFIGAEAAQGLDHAHRRRDEQGNPLGIVHRDVSPQNVMLSNEGAVKISDFGLVKAADNVVQTGSGMSIGKMSYMAPEQAGHAPVDARADVFALGIVVWEMLTMRTLLPPNDPARSSAMLQACEFPPPSRHNAKVSPALDEIVMRCLTKDPEQRTPSAQALSMQLREVLHELAPGYGREQLARLLGWAFPEKGWSIDEPHETAAQPSFAERMSMPQIPAAHAMAQAQEAAQAAVVTGRHSSQPAQAPGARVSQPAPAPPKRTGSALLWILVVLAAGVFATALLVVLLAFAFLALRSDDASDAARPSVAPLQLLPPVPGLWVETNVPGTRMYVGSHELGVAPVLVTADRLDGQPLVAIAPGHEPHLVGAEELARAVHDGRGRHVLSLASSPSPARAVFVRHPRSATARLAHSGASLGPVPGVLVVPRMTLVTEEPRVLVPSVVQIVVPDAHGRLYPLADCPPEGLCIVGP